MQDIEERMNNFSQRKKNILNKQDKSSIGKWDEKIIGLCKRINKSKNYYTTSSCAGRIVLIRDIEGERGNLFLKVWHDLVDVEELKRVWEKLKSIPPTHPKNTSLSSEINNSELIGKQSISEDIGINNVLAKSPDKIGLEADAIKFKQEPPIFHVACKNLESAEELLNKAKSVGWKRSGITSLGKNIVLELMSTEKLEFPIINESSKVLVNEDFLKLIIKKSNDNLKKGWEKIEDLKKTV
ncbi:MAG: tRNA wybutosine-synthesizing 3 family protein [archaeon]